VTLATCKNIPPSIAIVISAEMATLHELDTVYGVEDLYDMLEIITVDGENRRRMNKAQERKRGNRNR
jgi:hypothetical protein